VLKQERRQTLISRLFKELVLLACAEEADPGADSTLPSKNWLGLQLGEQVAATMTNAATVVRSWAK